MITINDIVTFAEKISDGSHDTIKPGMPISFSEASIEGDMIWQGDLGIGLTDGGPPEGYIKIEKIDNLCLVPNQDQSIGSKHCLSSSRGVTMWVPEVWDETVLDGPYLQLTEGATITHPVHGDVSIPSCFKEVQIIYQREWDQELARERRAAD